MTHLQPLSGALLKAAMPGLLAAAVEANPQANLEEMERELVWGQMQAWRLVEGAAGYLVTRTAYVRDTTTTALWPLYVAGRCLRPARQMMREIGDELIETASAWGLQEMRVAGRRALQWRRVLPGFEVAWQDGDRAELRKVLD